MTLRHRYLVSLRSAHLSPTAKPLLRWGRDGTIARSTNGGADWAPVPSGTDADLTNIAILPNRQPAEAIGGAALRPCEACPELVRVNGSEDIRSGFGTVAPFFIATTEVTRAAFQHYMDETGLEFVTAKTESGNTCFSWEGDKLRRNARAFGKSVTLSPNHPINCVSRADAIAYIDWLNERNNGPPYRLPTQGEMQPPPLPPVRPLRRLP